MPASEIAVMNRTAPIMRVRARAERIASADSATAASAARAPAIPAYTPKWWVHFVGVNIMKNMVPKMMRMSRSDGSFAAPGTRPLRRIAAMTIARQKNIMSTAKRRVSEPSTVCSMSVW